MNELTHLDLFSGIGGFAIAAQRAGFRTVGFSEVEPYACRILAERFPRVPNFGDVCRTGSFSGMGSPTVLTGGFPCQPWSIQGQKGGIGDVRHLWPAMLRVIETRRPAWVIGENVPNIISMGGADLALSDLENRGYTAQSFIIPASAIGSGHRRDRIWFIAHTERERLQGLEQDDGISCCQEAEDTEPLHRVLGARGSLVQHAGNLLPRDGVSVKMARAEIHGYGNAIVPQVVEPFFHWIAQIERGEIA